MNSEAQKLAYAAGAAVVVAFMVDKYPRIGQPLLIVVVLGSLFTIYNRAH